MDNAGWHASRRAERNGNFYENPQRGPDGHFQPVEQVYPVNDGFVGGFHANATHHHTRPRLHLDGPLPPLPPPPFTPTRPSYDNFPRTQSSQANGSIHHVSPVVSSRVQTAPSASTMSMESSTATSNGGSMMQNATFLRGLSAVERSHFLRAVRMQPYMQFMVGPLLRYDTVANGVWRGACLIVTADAGSIYEPHPMLRYEWDPIQATAISRSTSVSDNGRTFQLEPHPADPHSEAPTADSNGLAVESASLMIDNVPGHEIWVYVDPRGRSYTFWRFMLTVPLSAQEMCVKYQINSGQWFSFFVPGLEQNMRWAAYSCNGFSAGVNPDDFRGPGFDTGYDPLWVDLLRAHDHHPYHALVGGGDQLYCDAIVREPELQEWLTLPKPEMKLHYELTDEIIAAIDRFYFSHYCRVFQSGAFARATASIPMLNMCDDHDLIDGFGSYPDDLQRSPIFNAIGSRGYFFFLLFQCFIRVEVDGLDDSPGNHSFSSVIIGQRGPYIPFPSHSFLTYLGPRSAMLLLDCRAERRKDQVCSDFEYRKVFDRLHHLPESMDHLVIQLGIPIAYPRMVFMETFLESKFNPLVTLGKRGKMTGFVNKFNADPELADDLNDHWTSKGHKTERNDLICNLQEYAYRTRTRVTFLSGDVHCAAVGLLKTFVKDKKKADISPAFDHRYMLNVITSAIVNTPPPPMVISMVNSRASKTHQTLHHRDTDETMLALFTHDTDGSSYGTKYIMGRRNWCCVSYDITTGELIFDIRVEKEKGIGSTVPCLYTARAPPPRWNPS